MRDQLHLDTSAEDLADIEAAEAARAEIADGEATIPWEQVQADGGASRLKAVVTD